MHSIEFIKTKCKIKVSLKDPCMYKTELVTQGSKTVIHLYLSAFISVSGVSVQGDLNVFLSQSLIRWDDASFLLVVYVYTYNCLPVLYHVHLIFRFIQEDGVVCGLPECPLCFLHRLCTLSGSSFHTIDELAGNIPCFNVPDHIF